jgi:hypothetical protein
VYLPKENDITGRKYAKLIVSKQGICKSIRHMLSRTISKDIDMVNAHFALLHNLILKKPYIEPNKCNNVIAYANDRNIMYNAILKVFPKVPIGKLKSTLISMLFDENIDIEKHKYSKVLIFKEFITEIKYLQTVLYEATENEVHIRNAKNEILRKTEVLNETEDIDKKLKLNENLKGKVLARILQTEENKVLEAMIEYFDINKIVYSTLQFDGCELILPKQYTNLGLSLPYKNFKLNEDLLDKITTYIKEKLDIDIKLCYKELDSGLKVPATYIYSQEREYVFDSYNETDISELFIKRYKHILNIRKDNNEKYIKIGNLWTRNYKDFETGVKRLLSKMNVYCKDYDTLMDEYFNGKMTVSSYKLFIKTLKNYNINSKTDKINSIYKAFLLNEEYGTNDFDEKLLKSTIGYICYDDGVYSFSEKKLYDWDDIDIYSTIQINRTCPINRRVDDDINKVYEIFRDAYKPENYDVLDENFKAVARGLAGHATDKIWLLQEAGRNSNKGLETQMTDGAFKGYTGTMDSKDFLYKGSTDTAKDNYVFLDKEFARLIVIHEFQELARGSKEKLIVNGTLIKQITGGDKLICRAFHSDKLKYITPQFMIKFFCNKIPAFNSQDCLKNALYITSDYSFIPSKEMTCFDIEKPEYLLDNMNVKDFLNNDKYFDAFSHIIFDSYSNTKYVKSDKMNELLNIKKELTNQIDPAAILANYFEKGVDNVKNRLTKDFIKWFKNILFRRKEGKLSLLKDSECFALLAKIYGYKLARVEYLQIPIRCFTGIVLKEKYNDLFSNYIDDQIKQESDDF